MEKSLLFLPGPVAVADSVLKAMSRPLENHRGPEFAALLADVAGRMQPIFETIAMAKVSTSAGDARNLGFLRPADPVAMNRERLVADAKETALALVRAGYHPPVPAEIRVLGEEFIAAAKGALA